MKSTSLGRLIKVNLRDVFPTEAGSFTPWLAQEENLSLLAETIGINLQCEAQEKDVGPFRADILCKDTITDNWVLIENQIERTDHTHLGQLLTYAAGLQAVTIVWIAERFTEEHRAALDWLNEHTDVHINFFGLEIELWKIGDSAIAPKFNIVSQPNDWSRSVQAAARGSAEVTENRQLQLRFWLAFKEYMEKNSRISCQKPQPQNWMYHPVGKTGFMLSSVASFYNSVTETWEPEIRVQLETMGARAKQNFVALEKHRSEIERACGVPLTWHNPEKKNACRIYLRKDADFRQEELWPEQQKWLKEKLELFQRVFVPIIKELDSEPSAMAANA